MRAWPRVREGILSVSFAGPRRSRCECTAGIGDERRPSQMAHNYLELPILNLTVITC